MDGSALDGQAQAVCGDADAQGPSPRPAGRGGREESTHLPQAGMTKFLMPTLGSAYLVVVLDWYTKDRRLGFRAVQAADRNGKPRW